MADTESSDTDYRPIIGAPLLPSISYYITDYRGHRQSNSLAGRRN